MSDFSHLDQLALNLRFAMREREQNPDYWAERLAKLTRNGIDKMKAHALLTGAKPQPEEIDILVEMLGFEREELLSVPLYTRNAPLLVQNLCYLVDGIPHGHGRIAAEKIGIKESQRSRWKKWSGSSPPHPTNLKNLLKFHGLDPDLDLTRVPIFLSMEPLGGYAQKKWVADQLHEMPPSEVSEIYPALKKLLRRDEDH